MMMSSSSCDSLQKNKLVRSRERIYQCSGRHQDYSGSISERRPPSFYQSSELHRANGNSTGTVCRKQGEVRSGLREKHSIQCYTVSPAQLHNSFPPQPAVPKRVGLSIVEDGCLQERQDTSQEILSLVKNKNHDTAYLRAWTRLRSVNSWRSTKA